MDGAMAQQLADNIVTISKVSSSPASAGSHLNEDEAMDGAMAQQLADNIVTISKVSSSPASAGSHLTEDEAMDGAMAQQLADNVATIIDLTQSFGSDAKDDLSALKAAGKLSSRLRHQLGN